jgi:hypothetical protein
VGYLEEVWATRAKFVCIEINEKDSEEEEVADSEGLDEKDVKMEFDLDRVD